MFYPGAFCHWNMEVFEVQHSQRRGYMFECTRDQSLCWRYLLSLIVSAKHQVNSSAGDCCPRVVACASVSASVCSGATKKYANGGAVGLRCMVLAGFVVRNSVSSHKRKKNSAVTQLPRPPQGIFVYTCSFQGACYLEVHIGRRRLSFLPHSQRRTARAPAIR